MLHWKCVPDLAKALAAALLLFVPSERGLAQVPSAPMPELPASNTPPVIDPQLSRSSSPPRQVELLRTTQAPTHGVGLAELIQIGLENNPELRQAGLRVDAAVGRALQAGLYPNPTVSAEGSELGGRSGPGGFITAPIITQEVVTARKLRLDRQVGLHDADQSRWQLLAQRFVLLTAIRRGYFEVLAAQRRVEIYSELFDLASKATQTTETLVKGRQAAHLDLIQMRVELNRFRAELDAARQERLAAWRRLAATLGTPDLPDSLVVGTLEGPWPDYQFDAAVREILEHHPDVNAARVGVAKAQWALRRARVEPIPNVTFGSGYERDNVERQDQWVFRASLPLPVFNRNQGNIQAAAAEVGRAAAEVEHVQNLLHARLATAFGQYTATRERAERYRDSILRDATEAYELALQAFQGGQFEYLRVLQSQRALAEAKLEYVRALTELWLAASEIAGLLLEEDWPPTR